MKFCCCVADDKGYSYDCVYGNVAVMSCNVLYVCLVSKLSI